LSAYGALIWTRFLPMASQRRDTTILLTFHSEDCPQRAVDCDLLWAKLDIGVWAASGASLVTGTPSTAEVRLGAAPTVVNSM
jgi:hypothetical protein